VAFSQLQSAPNSETLLGELTALLQTHSWFKGTLLLRGRGGEKTGQREEGMGGARLP